MSKSAGRKVFSVIGVASLPARIKAAGKLENALMDRLEEMLRLEEIGDAVERLVVDQDSAEQRLLGLDVVRRRAECRFRGSLLACGRIEYAMVAVRGVARYGRFAANDRNAARGSVFAIHSTSRITQRPAHAPDRQQLHSTTNVSSIVEPSRAWEMLDCGFPRYSPPQGEQPARRTIGA